MYNPFSLKNKTILVTGASSGIGKATAIECSKMGAHLIIIGRNKKKLDETSRLLEGINHSQITGDLTNPDFIDELTNQLTPLDGIVNSAGITSPLPFKFINKQNIDHIFSINFNAPALLTKSLVKYKKIKNGGAIVFVSSISGVLTTYYGNTIYSASKGAINGLAKGMALELAKQNIRVNTVIPAMIETNLLDDIDTVSQEEMNKDAENYPLQRYGKPEEVAHAIIYLLSDASRWTTGTNLLIDGGLTLR